METRSARQDDGKERKENYGKRGQSSYFRNFNRSSRPSFKKQSYGYNESRPQYENRNREESKKRLKMPDNQNVRGRYTPREEAQKDKTALVP